MRVHVATNHPDFLNQRDTDQPSATVTELVCDEDLFQLISTIEDDMEFSLNQPQEIEDNVILYGEHYQVNGSVIRYCR